MSGGAPRTIIRTPAGRWVWQPWLDVVDWIPKGKRAPLLTVPVNRNALSSPPGAAAALYRAARVIANSPEDYL